MRKWIFSLVIVLVAAMTMQAQPEGRPVQERIQALRTAFITNRLNLTPEEAQQFWPLFNQFEAEQKKIRDKYRPSKDLMAMTDAEAERFINNHVELEQEMLNLKKDYMQRMRKVLPVRKVAMLMRIEQDFREHLVENLQQMRANAQGGAGPRRAWPRN